MEYGRLETREAEKKQNTREEWGNSADLSFFNIKYEKLINDMENKQEQGY